MTEYRRILLDGFATEVVRHGETLVASDGREVAVEDAVHLPPMVPSIYSGKVIRGKPTRMARLTAGVIEMPQRYQDDSFFGVQGQAAAAAAE